MRRSIAFAGLLLALSVSAVASAQDTAPSADDIKRAAAAYDRGRDSYRMESYVEAAEQFEAADGFAPSAAALRLAMLARKAAGQLDRAATHAALALERHGDDAALQKEAQAVVDEQAASLGKVTVSCDEPCDLLLDNKIVHGKSSVNRTLYVAPGSHTLRAAWSDKRNKSEKLEIEAGASEALSFLAPAVPEDSAVAEPLVNEDGSAVVQKRKGGWSPVVFWTGAGVTLAGAGVSTFLGIRALNEPGPKTVETACLAGAADCQSLYDQGVQNQTIATIAISATAAVGVFTVITGLWLTDWSGDSSEAAADEAPTAEGTSQGSRIHRSRQLARRSTGFKIRPTFSFGDGATVGATGTF